MWLALPRVETCTWSTVQGYTLPKQVGTRTTLRHESSTSLSLSLSLSLSCTHARHDCHHYSGRRSLAGSTRKHGLSLRRQDSALVSSRSRAAGSATDQAVRAAGCSSSSAAAARGAHPAAVVDTGRPISTGADPHFGADIAPTSSAGASAYARIRAASVTAPDANLAPEPAVQLRAEPHRGLGGRSRARQLMGWQYVTTDVHRVVVHHKF